MYVYIYIYELSFEINLPFYVFVYLNYFLLCYDHYYLVWVDEKIGIGSGRDGGDDVVVW